MFLSRNQINQISKLHGLEKLFGNFKANIVFPTIVGLKELIILYTSLGDFDLESLTQSFPNLRQIFACTASINKLLPLIQRLPKLKSFCIQNFESYETDKQIDLFELNEERKKLPGACKLTIYVSENVYLSTKMANINLYTKHDLIEIKRIESANMQDVYKNCRRS